LHHFATALCAGLFATVVVGGPTLTPAEAAKTPSADAVALKETTAACKAEAKENKIRWPASRKFVSNCVAKAVKPAELQKIAVKQATVACPLWVISGHMHCNRPCPRHCLRRWLDKLVTAHIADRAIQSKSQGRPATSRIASRPSSISAQLCVQR
jgi:hypothetical protein